jgi:hypothetical protein
MDSAAATAGHRKKLESPLKQWVSWIGYLHVTIVSRRCVSVLLVSAWGIEN